MYSPFGYMAGLRAIEQAAKRLETLPLQKPVKDGRRGFLRNAVEGSLALSGVSALLAACGGEQNSNITIAYLTPTSNSSEAKIAGTPVPQANPFENVDGTPLQYVSFEAHVPQGYSLVLALQAGTQQDVGLFRTQSDLNTYIGDHKRAKVPVYRQPEYFPTDTTQPYILVIEQDVQEAFDLVVLARNGNQPTYVGRIVPNDQVTTVIGQLQTVHPELQNIEPFTLPDTDPNYQYTGPHDPNFA